MKYLFNVTFAPENRKPVTLDVFGASGQRWIKAAQLAKVLNQTIRGLRAAMHERVAHSESMRRLAELEPGSGEAFCMLSIDAARRLVLGGNSRRKLAILELCALIERIAQSL